MGLVSELLLMANSYKDVESEEAGILERAAARVTRLKRDNTELRDLVRKLAARLIEEGYNLDVLDSELSNAVACALGE